MKITVEGLDAIVLQLGEQPRKIQRAAIRAINRGIKSGRTFMARSIAQDTGLKVGTVRDALGMELASESTGTASLSADLKRIPLIQFNAKDTGFNKGTGRRSNARVSGVRSRAGSGVTYRMGGVSSRVEDAFIATMVSGHQGVFRRASRARLPIRELFGPSLGHVFLKYRQDGIERVLEMFQKNFGHELEVESQGFIKAGPDEQGTPDETDVAA
jgi:hypothetical protein